MLASMMMSVGRTLLDIGEGTDHREDADKKEKKVHDALLGLKGKPPFRRTMPAHHTRKRLFTQEGTGKEDALPKENAPSRTPPWTTTSRCPIIAEEEGMGYHDRILHFHVFTGKNMIRVDLHTHTNHSHARDSVRQMFDAGQARGLLVQGFSEHSPRPEGYDYPEEYREHLAATFDEYLSEVADLREEQKSRGITVLLGLEVDWLEDEIPYIRRMTQSHPYDYLIGGIHFLGRWGFDSSADDWKDLSFEERCDLYVRYYRTMKSMAETRLFHIVAHPDLIKIFPVDDFHRWLELPASMDLVGDALTAVRDAGMAMEISSAGLRKSCREIYPGPKILHLARNLGLPITFASDSHATDQVAWNFDTLARYAASEGWTESLVFCKGHVTTMPFSAGPLLRPVRE